MQTLSEAIAVALTGTPDPCCAICGAPAFASVSGKLFCRPYYQEGACADARPDLYDLPSLIDAHDDALALLAERDAEIAELNKTIAGLKRNLDICNESWLQSTTERDSLLIRLAEYREVNALATAALERYFALYGALA